MSFWPLAAQAARPASQIFDPASLPNMVWRVRAALAVTSSGGTLIDSIPNEGTLGHGASNVNDMAWATARPKYKGASGNYNGKPAVLHDGNQFLTTGSLSTPIAQPSTFYAYTNFNDTNVAASVAIRLNNGSSANAAALAFTPSTDTLLYTEIGTNQIVTQAMYGKHLVCVVYNGTSTQLFIDDMTTPVATATSGGTGACAAIQTGLFNASLQPLEWPEQIAYGVLHTALERGLVGSYFKATYADDPSQYALSGFYQDNPGASQVWPGIASRSTSGAHSLDNTAGYSAGSLNGHGYATFNGADQRLVDATNAFGTYVSESQYTIGAVVRCRNPLAPQGSPFNDPGPVGDANAFGAFRWTTSGFAWYHVEASSSTRKTTPFVAAASNAWHKVWARFNSSTGVMEIKVDGGAWSQLTGVGAMTTIPGSVYLSLGRTYAATGTTFCDCDVAAVVTAQTPLDDATIADIDSYFTKRFGI